MADRALGKPCPNCGTLVTCPGNHGDEVLVGTCSYCNATVTAQNYNIVNGTFVPVVAQSPEDVKADDVNGAIAAAAENVAPVAEPESITPDASAE